MEYDSLDKIPTPFYLIHEDRLSKNLNKIDHLRAKYGIKVILSLKGFSMPYVFPYLQFHLDGVVGISLNEVRLGSEEFGREIHGYFIGGSEPEMMDAAAYVNTMIFNSLSLLRRYRALFSGASLGIRVNTGFEVDDADRDSNKFGVCESELSRQVIEREGIEGFLFHHNAGLTCKGLDTFFQRLESICARYEQYFPLLKWINFGGGVNFTLDGFRLDDYGQRLAQIKQKYGVDIYLEPVTAVVCNSGSLVCSVVDILEREKTIGVLDISMFHMYYRHLKGDVSIEKASKRGKYSYMLVSRTCNHADSFGEFSFDRKLSVGDRIYFKSTLEYSLPLANWFNGLTIPAVVMQHSSRRLSVLKAFTYDHFLNSC